MKAFSPWQTASGQRRKFRDEERYRFAGLLAALARTGG
jgi:hypothetical protein